MSKWGRKYVRVAVAALLVASSLNACGPVTTRDTPANVQTMIDSNDWAGAIGYYREALEQEPSNAAHRIAYYSVAENAVRYYLENGRRSRDTGDFENAEAQISRGLLIVPSSQILRQELESLQGIKQGRLIYQSALVSHQLGRNPKALEQLEEALSLDPSNYDAVALFNQLTREAYNETSIEPIRLESNALITVNFNRASFKDSFLALGSAYGVNIVFDADVDDKPVTIRAEDVGFEQAFNLMLRANRSFYRRLGQNTVLIIPDNAEKRTEYEDYIVRTFFLNAAQADAIAQILATTLGLQNISVNSEVNSITIRDTIEKLALADRLISNNDRELPEVVLEVEILEVNRTKSEQLGVDFGSQIRISPPSITAGDVFNGGLGDLLDTSIITLPAVTLRYFKQDVDAVTLASPRIRTIHEVEALIHIGDRVPLRASTVQDATGQTRTTFEYRDIGIKLRVIPDIGLNGSVTVGLNLEVSSLGQNLGTSAEPAFSIGTRNIETDMVLADGETAIIGGLIRDEQRETIQRVPGLGDIPLVGRLFQSRDNQDTRTDILLTLTPRVVRGWDLPSAAESQFFSGTGQRVSDTSQFEFMAPSDAEGVMPTIRLDMSGNGNRVLAERIRQDVQASLPISSANAVASGALSSALSFEQLSYEGQTGESITVKLKAAGLDLQETEFVIRFKEDIVEAVSINTLGNPSISAQINNAAGEINFDMSSMTFGPDTVFAEITFQAKRAGLSYLIYAKPANGGQGNALPASVQLQTSRIIAR